MSTKKNKNVIVRFPEPLVKRLHKICDTNATTVSDFVRRATLEMLRAEEEAEIRRAEARKKAKGL